MSEGEGGKADSSLEQYRALLEVSESIALHRDLGPLLHDLAGRLHRVVPFDFICLVLPQPASKTARLHVLESLVPTRAQPGLELPLDEAIVKILWEEQQPLVIPNVDEEERFPAVTRLLREDKVKSFCLLPLATALRPVGSLGFGSIRESAYGEADLDFLERVAAQVAVAVDNALNYQSVQSYQQQLARERDRLRMLLEVTNTMVANLDVRELFTAISAGLRRVIPHEYASLALHDPESNRLRIHALEFPSGRGFIQEEMVGPAEGTPAGWALATRKPLLLDAEGLSAFRAEVARLLLAEGLESLCCLPMMTPNRVLGTLNIGSRRPGAFTQEDVDLLSQVANQIAVAMENALAYQEIAELKDLLAKEKLYLEDEIRTEYDFEEIVGESPALKRILRQVETVAPTDATVLIHGETGTGKELIARAIHNLSARRERTLVKVNCAAIPTGLLESELFGHERGAFTGAIEQKIGRFELGHQGTIFLDEVGDIPLELQPKLLRVLQEHEFERLGSTRTVRVDVRVVAATNRDLAQMVGEGKYRRDLFYRLNVFPIVVPALRERPEDIPLLLRYFAQKYARSMNKPIETIPNEDLEKLTRYPWPGNVRELENLIERAVILTPGTVLRVPLPEPSPSIEDSQESISTLEAAERAHILRALRETRWVVGGPQGAAVRLGMKRTTLQSRMHKLGITRRIS
jgi:formate hydrogenlyase transcriptional activator